MIRHEAIKKAFKETYPIDESILDIVADYFVSHPTQQVNLELRPKVKDLKLETVASNSTWAYIYIPDVWVFQALELFTREGFNVTYHRDKRYISITLI